MLCRAPALAQRVAGVYTFGAPRFGDAGCAEALAQAYGGRLFRYVHAADLVSLCAMKPASINTVSCQGQVPAWSCSREVAHTIYATPNTGLWQRAICDAILPGLHMVTHPSTGCAADSQ